MYTSLLVAEQIKTAVFAKKTADRNWKAIFHSSVDNNNLTI